MPSIWRIELDDAAKSDVAKTDKRHTCRVDGHRVIEPRPCFRYSLDDLLAQCADSVEMTEEERAWFHAEPSGREWL